MTSGIVYISIAIFFSIIALMFAIAVIKNIIFNPKFYIFVYHRVGNKVKELRSDQNAIKNAQQAVNELRERGYIVELRISQKPVVQTVQAVQTAQANQPITA